MQFPPDELIQRVGKVDGTAGYDNLGRWSRSTIEGMLPTDWSWAGKKVLDFGCGAGRTLRHFLPEATHPDPRERAEFHGCDIDVPSIEWLRQHMSPPLEVFLNQESPPIDRASGYFDLVYALSVFTHLTDSWADWLVEIHRVLKPGGLFVATTLGAAHWPVYNTGPWNEERTGMVVLRRWQPWSGGGPIVFHSEWWLREHWGRAFEVVRMSRGEGVNHGDRSIKATQDMALFRALPLPITAAQLRAPSNDVREEDAAQYALELVQLESETFGLSSPTTGEPDLSMRLERLESEMAKLRRETEEMRGSHSWRMTAPLRAGGRVARRLARAVRRPRNEPEA